MEIDDYVNSVNARIDKNDLGLKIDFPSLRRYMIREFGDILDIKLQFGYGNDRIVIEELNKMGIKTIQEIKDIIPSDFKERYVNLEKPLYGTYVTGIIRNILIIHDWNRYIQMLMMVIVFLHQHEFMVLQEFGVDIDRFARS